MTEYKRPSEALERVLDIDNAPSLLVAPGGRSAAVLRYKGLPLSIEELARERVETAGLAFDPVLRIPEKKAFAASVRIRRIFRGAHSVDNLGGPLEGTEVNVTGLPSEAKGFGFFSWSADGKRLVFSVKVQRGNGSEEDEMQVFCVDVEEEEPTATRILNDRVINAVVNFPYKFVGDGSALLAYTVPESNKPVILAKEKIPTGPNIQENLSKKNVPARTYQRLISSKRDEELYEYYTKSEIILVVFDLQGKCTEQILDNTKGGLLLDWISLSPDRTTFLVSLISKPFSWTLPEYKFPKTIQTWHLSRQISKHPAPRDHTAALSKHPAYPERGTVRAVPFQEEDEEYAPVEFTHKVVQENNRNAKENGWADPELNDMPLSELEERLTYNGSVFLVNGRPQNPVGRTGMTGRGLLGKWGPNHAADAIVTRSSPEDRSVLQMVAIQRKDTGQWAIPGGMVDPGESVPAAMKREFLEEAGNLKQGPDEAARHKQMVDDMFQHGREIYRGYVDDPRNTDNAWMESSFVHFHCSEALGNSVPLEAGDDAQSVQWLDIDEKNESFANLYASHKEMVLKAASIHRGDHFPFEEIRVTCEHTVADVPDQEGVVISFDARAAGPRGFAWHWQLPSSILFKVALDDGNPKEEAEKRDALFVLNAPYRLRDHFENPEESEDSSKIFEVDFRISSVSVTKASTNVMLVREFWRKTRKTRTWAFRPFSTQKPVLLFDRSTEDAYGSPGSFQTEFDENGRIFLQQETDIKRNRLIFEMLGNGASSIGSRPFYNRLHLDATSLKIIETERIWRCVYATDADESQIDLEKEVNGKLLDDAEKNAVYESPLDLMPGAAWLLLRRESNDEPPAYYWRHVESGQEWQIFAVEHPQPDLIGVQKNLIQYRREDGLELNGDLYLPKGYNPEKDGPRKCLLWAYPREFKSTETAGQIKSSPHRFTQTSWSRPVSWVVKDWVVLGFSSPIVSSSPQDEPNDNFIEQVQLNARAAVKLLIDRGMGKRGGFAVGGHSYGAFMTAHLLAHTDLFSAGIARSGAYLRALTPFGFQAEERTFWEAPETYAELSPFTHVPNIAKNPGKLLLIHGLNDENSGTFPLQSERLFNALKGHGAITKLVQLPCEGHGYSARESILHVIYEQEEWLDKFVNLEEPEDGVCKSLSEFGADGEGFGSHKDRARALQGATAILFLALAAFKMLRSKI